MAKKWLDNFKEKVSDWYYDGDQFYLRTIVDPFIELGKNITNSGQQVSEYVTPVYSDIKVGADMLEGGVADLQQGNYLNGVGKMAASVPLSVVSLLAIDGADLPVKAAAKRMNQPLEVYTAKTLGGKVGKGRPAKAKLDGTNKPITKRDVIEALRTYLNPSKVSKETVKKANWEATSAAVAKHTDNKAMNKASSKSAGETRMNMTQSRTGHTPVQSVGKQVTQYDAERLTSGFTWQASPLGRTRADGVIQQNWKLFLEHAQKLKFDTKSKDSVKELEKIFNNTYQHLFKKHGGSLNYLTLFS